MRGDLSDKLIMVRAKDAVHECQDVLGEMAAPDVTGVVTEENIKYCYDSIGLDPFG
jgi:hypothetical protein